MKVCRLDDIVPDTFGTDLPSALSSLAEAFRRFETLIHAQGLVGIRRHEHAVLGKKLESSQQAKQ